ncbi:MAG: tetratricopeptide repeat protein [Prosthecobacter sp.]|nr:tetratricopeptide repeat protein [Prosthecobacter sp.]
MCALGEFLAKEKQKFKKAGDLIHRAYEADPENPDRLNDYGRFLLYSLSDGRRAESLLRQAVQRRTDTLGLEDPSTLRSRMNLASALRYQGKYSEAEYRSVVAIQERVLGTEHPGTLSTLFNLALNLEFQGQLPDALTLMQRTEEGRVKVLGLDYPDTKSAGARLKRIQVKMKKPKGKKSGKLRATTRKRGTE